MRMFMTSVSSAALAATLLVATPALAQDAPPPADGTDAAATSGDIIVTAQRRNERLQDVPASISVLSVQSLAQQGVNDFGDLAFRIPNVQIFENSNLAGRSSVTIRGIPGRAGIYVDDVFVGDNSGINTLLVDIDRVEVVRGPQGTLYGRNAISGAINTITRRPGDEFFAMGKVRYGSYNSLYGAAAVGGPLGSDFSAKVSGAYRATDGYDRLATGERVNGDKDYAFQAQLRFHPNDRIDLWVSGEYEKDDGRQGYTDAVADYSINGEPSALYLNATRDGNPYDRILPARSTLNRAQRDAWAVSGHADIAIGSLKLASITAYRSIDFLYNRDGDGTSLSIIDGTQPVKFHQFSQELRLLSPTGGTFEWQVGAYYFNSKRQSRDQNYIGPDYVLTVNPGLAPFAPAFYPGTLAGAVTFGRLSASPILQSILRPIPDPVLQAIFALGTPNNGGFQTTFDSNSIESFSGFASATWRPLPRVEITAGGRYTHETVKASYGRDATGVVALLTPPIAAQQLNNGGNDNFSPNANITYKPNRHVTAYFTYATGFRSGGFNTAPAALVPPANDAQLRSFKPETVTSYEVGLKTAWLDNRLIANIALFRSNYTDFQRSFYNITSTGTVTNQTFNTSATMQGLELEIVAKPSRELTVSANYGYQDSSYDNYPNAVISSYLRTGSPLTVNLTGQSLPFVPKHSVAVDAQYEHQFADNLSGQFGADVQLRSKYNVADGVDQIRVVRSIVQLGVHAGIADPDGKWQIVGRVYNLTNEVYRTSLDYNSFVGTVYQTLSAPRTFAIEAGFRF